MTHTILKTAEPTIVPTPTSPLATKMPRDIFLGVFFPRYSSIFDENYLPIIAVKSSGDDDPPAMNVAPATSSSSCKV